MIFVMFSCPSSSIPAYLGHSIYLTYPAHLTYMTCLYWERARVARHGEKGLPRPTPQKGGFAPPHPVKITKTCGAQRSKVDFNPLKFGRQRHSKLSTVGVQTHATSLSNIWYGWVMSRKV